MSTWAGRQGWRRQGRQLADRGMRLMLDFVPNHVAPDHPWVTEHPDYFVQGSTDDVARKPGEFFQAGGKVLALGRDPYFAAWPDVVQFNGFHPGFARRSSRPWDLLPGNATVCAAIWRCCS